LFDAITPKLQILTYSSNRNNTKFNRNENIIDEIITTSEPEKTYRVMDDIITKSVGNLKNDYDVFLENIWNGTDSEKIEKVRDIELEAHSMVKRMIIMLDNSD